MYARNSSGRSVSLLNNDSAESTAATRGDSRGSSTEAYSPPELQQTGSFESSPRSAPISPTTPTAPHAHVHVHDAYRAVYEYHAYVHPGSHHPQAYVCGDGYAPPVHHAAYAGPPPSGPYDGKMAAGYSSSSHATYDGEPPAHHASPAEPKPEKAKKRYPCRLRNEYNCDKTFTTSGHASRHARAHDNERGVPCDYPTCDKKFTRTDNMKQHLNTHLKKNKARKPAQKGHERKPSHHQARRGSQARARPPPINTAVHGPPAGVPLQSPAGAYDLGALNSPLMAVPGGPPMTSPTTRLDALVMAATHQGDL